MITAATLAFALGIALAAAGAAHAGFTLWKIRHKSSN